MSVVIIAENNNWVQAFKALAHKTGLNANDIEHYPNVSNLKTVKYLVVWKPPLGVYAKFPNLKAVFNLGAGVDHLLLDLSLPKNIPIVRIVDDNLTKRMGEFVCLHTLYHLRGMAGVQKAQRQTQWLQQADPIAAEVTVGIMGLGEIGTYCAKLLLAVGFNVIGWSNSKKHIKGVQSFAGNAELTGFLNQTEILINLLPHTPDTDKLVNYKLLSQLNSDGLLRGASFINAGRGKTHVEDDIIKALNDGCLKSASLDVFEAEPLASNSPLWTMENLILTPHNAATSDRRTVTLQILEQISTHMSGGELKNRVDLARGY